MWRRSPNEEPGQDNTIRTGTSVLSQRAHECREAVILETMYRNDDKRPQKPKARHDSSSHRASSCPSWARTRTVLIQSLRPRAPKTDNLTGNGVPTSIGALSV